MAHALRRLERRLQKERHRPYKWYGPMAWMIVTKEYYQKPGFLRRMMKASQKVRGRKRMQPEVFVPIRDAELDRLTE